MEKHKEEIGVMLCKVNVNNAGVSGVKPKNLWTLLLQAGLNPKPLTSGIAVVQHAMQKPSSLGMPASIAMLLNMLL